MHVLKFINGKNRKMAGLKSIIEYVRNPEKTSLDLLDGFGVSANTVYNDMKTIKSLHCKNRGRQFIHFIVSLPKNEKITKNLVHEIGMKICLYFANDYQIFAATHTNTQHLHTHFIMNSVNVHTGKKFSQSKTELCEFKEHINSILKEFSLDSIDTWENIDVDANEGNLLGDEELWELLRQGDWNKDLKSEFNLVHPLSEKKIDTYEGLKKVIEFERQKPAEFIDEETRHRPLRQVVEFIDEETRHRPLRQAVEFIDKETRHRPLRQAVEFIDKETRHRPLQQVVEFIGKKTEYRQLKPQ